MSNKFLSSSDGVDSKIYGFRAGSGWNGVSLNTSNQLNTEIVNTSLAVTSASTLATTNTAISTLDATLVGAEACQNSRSVLTARRTDGKYENIEATQFGHLECSIKDPLSAFGEVVVVQPTPVVQQVFSYNGNLNGRLWSATISGSSTFGIENNMMKVTTGVTPGSTPILQTRKKLKYRAGEGIIVRFTTLFDAAFAGTSQYMGFGDSQNGYFVGYDDVNFGILHRVGGVDTWVAQTAWNIDKADGTKSLLARNWQRLQIWEIAIGYLGTAPVQFKLFNGGAGGNEFLTCHEFDFAGNRTSPHLANSTLPFYAAASNGVTSNNLIMRSASLMLAIAGYTRIEGFTNNFDHTKTPISTTATNILTIRNDTTHQAQTNNTVVYPIRLSVGLVDAKRTTIVRLLKDTTLGGSPSYVAVGGDSVVSTEIVGTTTTGGTSLGVFVMSIDSSIDINLKELEIELQPGETLTVSASTITADSATITAAISWREDF